MIGHKNELVRVYGDIDLVEPLIVFNGTLGTSHKISIEGISGLMHFPNYPQKKPSPNDLADSPNLLPPSDAKNWRRGDEQIDWGSLAANHDSLEKDYLSSVRVEKLLFTFDIDKTELINCGNAIRNGFESWLKQFINYVNFLTKQNRQQHLQISTFARGLDLFYWGENNKQIRPTDNGEITIHIRGNLGDVSLSKKQLKIICIKMLKGESLRSEYLIQLEAYKTHSVGDYRKAIIESAVAAEIAITSAILDYFSVKEINYGIDLIKKFRMLSGRIELARILSIDLPDIDLNKLLVEPRNDVIHKAKFANESVSMRATQVTDRILEIYNPELFKK